MSKATATRVGKKTVFKYKHTLPVDRVPIFGCPSEEDIKTTLVFGMLHLQLQQMAKQLKTQTQIARKLFKIARRRK